MDFPSKLLNPGENVVVHLRTHPKALIRPAIVTILLAVVVGWIATIAPDGTSGTVVGVVVGVVAVVILILWVVRPVIDWLTTTYTFTNRRFIKRSGFVSREGRTIPLNRISGVDFEIGVIDRIFGCGTLVVSDASTEGTVPLHDVPNVEEVQLKVAHELHRLSSGDRQDDGS